MTKKWCWKQKEWETKEPGKEQERQKDRGAHGRTGKRTMCSSPTGSNDSSSWARVLILFPWTHLNPVRPRARNPTLGMSCFIT